jgi:hypothetical protein
VARIVFLTMSMDLFDLNEEYDDELREFDVFSEDVLDMLDDREDRLRLADLMLLSRICSVVSSSRSGCLGLVFVFSSWNCLDKCSRSMGVTFLDAVRRFNRSLAFSSTPIMNASFRFSFITNSRKLTQN